MGVQQYSAKSVRRLARQTGLDLDMVWSKPGGGEWRSARIGNGPGHRHVRVNVRTVGWVRSLF